MYRYVLWIEKGIPSALNATERFEWQVKQGEKRDVKWCIFAACISRVYASLNSIPPALRVKGNEECSADKDMRIYVHN